MAGGTASFGTALLVGAGIVESMIVQFIGFERAGLNYVIKKSIEEGVPRRVQVEDESNLTFNLRCLAGSLNLPFIPSISGSGETLTSEDSDTMELTSTGSTFRYGIHSVRDDESHYCRDYNQI